MFLIIFKQAYRKRTSFNNVRKTKTTVTATGIYNLILPSRKRNSLQLLETLPEENLQLLTP